MSPGAGRLAFRPGTLTETAPYSRLLSCFLCDRDWRKEWVPLGHSPAGGGPPPSQALKAAGQVGGIH